jgi:hypothetical protein
MPSAQGDDNSDRLARALGQAVIESLPTASGIDTGRIKPKR